MIRPKSCTVCGVRTLDGKSRCAQHQSGGARSRPCVICGRPTGGPDYCLQHKPVQDEVARLAAQPWRKEYRHPTYVRNRQARFEQAGGCCELCGTQLQPGGWECDHLLPLSQGGTHAVPNLRVLCKPCHRRKTAADRRGRNTT